MRNIMSLSIQYVSSSPEISQTSSLSSEFKSCTWVWIEVIMLSRPYALHCRTWNITLHGFSLNDCCRNVYEMHCIVQTSLDWKREQILLIWKVSTVILLRLLLFAYMQERILIYSEHLKWFVAMSNIWNDQVIPTS